MSTRPPELKERTIPTCSTSSEAPASVVPCNESIKPEVAKTTNLQIGNTRYFSPRARSFAFAFAHGCSQPWCALAVMKSQTFIQLALLSAAALNSGAGGHLERELWVQEW